MTSSLKGFQITNLPTDGAFIPVAFNSLNAAWWSGLDDVLRVIRDPLQQAPFRQITAEYCHRIPHDISAPEAANVRLLGATFKNAWVLGNEPDGWWTPAENAALITAMVTNIIASNPAINNKFVLSAGTQRFDRYGAQENENYALLTWALLPQNIKSVIDVLGGHYYLDAEQPGNRYNPEMLQHGMTVLCDTATQMGIPKVWVTEFGWGMRYVNNNGNPTPPKPQDVANFLPQAWSVFDEFPMIKRTTYYTANSAAQPNDYLPLYNNSVRNLVGNVYAGL